MKSLPKDDKVSYRFESALWFVPLIGVICILVAWSIAYSLGQEVGEREREAFNETRQAQVESCERVNLLRMEFNTHVIILDSFLLEAAAGDVDAISAERYLDLADELRPLDLTDCEASFPNYIEGFNG